ncbi:hypothetical protein [Mycobacterium sp. AZCC_0083]|uniref:hypothetical protein n=1 Tax=Mycobacterium sp. AZCC_0083 TaxID=2735882 RepID=UPI001607AC8A|nr:hypothetical protein [Mycobacterium sp. AZCC_0083]MBB5163716.1 putative membrane protein YhdT [Mycobacterium sp. AZCC_0083]
MGQLPPDEDPDSPAKSKRGAVVIFLLGWLVLPLSVVILGELEPPWYRIACFGVLAFVVVFIMASVRVVRRF